MGILGGVCGLLFVGLLFWRGISGLQSQRSYFARATIAGSLAACAGLLLHGLVDFNFHIPANALIFLLLSGIATADWMKAPILHFIPTASESSESTLPFSRPITYNI